MRDRLEIKASILIVALLACTPAGAQTVRYSIDGLGNGDLFGLCVGGGGDVNGDGTPDFIAGAPESHPTAVDAGYARVFSGRDGTLLFAWNGDSIGDAFGLSVCIAGDVDRDGRADLAVGAPLDDNIGASSGMVRVLSGRTGSILYTFDGSAAGDELGSSVSAAGDVNSDGYADVLAGAPQESTGAGYARVYSGRDGSVLRTFNGLAMDDLFGVSVSLAGDVDADGVSDLILGALDDDTTGPDAGAARVYSGANGSLLRAFFGASAGDEFGNAVSGTGDVNRDGYADLLIGAWHDHAGGFLTPGSVSVLSGKDGALLYHFVGITGDDLLGRGLSGAGDVDGDGWSDFMFAARHDIDAQHTGAVYVCSGRDGALIYTLYGDRAPDDFGLGLSAAGDLDGDGFGDILIGATEGYHALPREGYLRVFLGTRAHIVTYGESCPGSGGAHPRLHVGGAPASGSRITLDIAHGLGGMSAILYIGRSRGPFGAGGAGGAGAQCPLLVADLLPVRLPIALSGSGAGNGAGSREWRMPALTHPSTITLQALIRDPGVAGGRSATNAIEITVP